MNKIDEKEESWAPLVELLYAPNPDEALPQMPNVTFQTDKDLKRRLAQAVAYELIEDRITALDTLWDLEMRYSGFYNDLSLALREDWSLTLDNIDTDLDKDDEDYAEASEEEVSRTSSDEESMNADSEEIVSFNGDSDDSPVDGPSQSPEVESHETLGMNGNPPIYTTSARRPSQPPLRFTQPPWWTRPLTDPRTGRIVRLRR